MAFNYNPLFYKPKIFIKIVITQLAQNTWGQSNKINSSFEKDGV